MGATVRFTFNCLPVSYWRNIWGQLLIHLHINLKFEESQPTFSINSCVSYENSCIFMIAVKTGPLLCSCVTGIFCTYLCKNQVGTLWFGKKILQTDPLPHFTWIVIYIDIKRISESPTLLGQSNWKRMPCWGKWAIFSSSL